MSRKLTAVLFGFAAASVLSFAADQCKAQFSTDNTPFDTSTWHCPTPPPPVPSKFDDPDCPNPPFIDGNGYVHAGAMNGNGPVVGNAKIWREYDAQGHAWLKTNYQDKYGSAKPRRDPSNDRPPLQTSSGSVELPVVPVVKHVVDPKSGTVIAQTFVHGQCVSQQGVAKAELQQDNLVCFFWLYNGVYVPAQIDNQTAIAISALKAADQIFKNNSANN